jgi:hypothetical protein
MSIVNSIKNQEEVKLLLDKQLPNYRQAYSDRTAWIMACVSELAYIKFNPMIKSKKYFIEHINKIVKTENNKLLYSLIEKLDYDHEAERVKLEDDCRLLNFKLVKTFDTNGTQAILIENDDYICLGFRGTEPTSMKDIKTDMRANTVPCESGGMVHKGFNDAFAEIVIEIQETLNGENLKSKPLFITGHSLGGALATIAIKHLKHKGGIASCYTFGSPRVGDEKWMENIKTPVYRLVNAADPVTMLPPGDNAIDILSFIIKIVPRVGNNLSRILNKKLGGYLHIGDMRYLKNCPSGNYDEVQLLYSVSIIYRIKAIIKLNRIFKILADHSITTYRKKLYVIATRRNL